MNGTNILRLKEVLKEKGITGKELAEMIGLTETSISRIVKGGQYPKFETLLKIASVLDVDVRELINPTKAQEHTEIFKKVGDEYISIGFLKD